MLLSYSFLTSDPTFLGLLLYGPFALALVCYIWASCSQRHKLHGFRQVLILCLKRRENEQRGAQNIYFSTFFLLLSDGLTVIFGLVWSIMVFCGKVSIHSLILSNIWHAFRLLSICQHLNIALVSILFISRPKWGQQLLKVSKILTLVPCGLVIVGFNVVGLLILLDIYCLLITVAIVVSCRLPTTTSMAQQRKIVTLLAAAMFFLICFPSAVLNGLLLSSQYNYYIPIAVKVLLITNIYIVMNAGLFYLVLKIKEEDQHETLHEVNSVRI